MHILDAAMAAALLDRSHPKRPTELNDARRDGIRSLARVGIALGAVALFYVTMEAASRTAPRGDEPRVAIERLN